MKCEWIYTWPLQTIFEKEMLTLAHSLFPFALTIYILESEKNSGCCWWKKIMERSRNHCHLNIMGLVNFYSRTSRFFCADANNTQPCTFNTAQLTYSHMSICIQLCDCWTVLHKTDSWCTWTYISYSSDYNFPALKFSTKNLMSG